MVGPQTLPVHMVVLTVAIAYPLESECILAVLCPHRSNNHPARTW